MAIPDVVLDPDGDLLVILRKPLTIDDSPDEPVLFEPLSDTAGSDSDGEATLAESDSDEESELINVDRDWVFKASSTHISLACPRFKTMMNGPWCEATRVYDDGLRRWVLEGFDLKAMIVVLNIIHGKNKDVSVDDFHLDIPWTIEFNTLVEIARIVDYVECYEVMKFFASVWIGVLKKDIPVSYGADLLSWICVAGVFREREIFKECTRLAIVQSHSGVPTFGLPILPEISDEIDRLRVHYLDEIFQFAYRLVDELTSKNSCSSNCNATRLGVLARYMHDNALSPRPTSPYLRLSVDWAVGKINGLPSIPSAELDRTFEERMLDGWSSWPESFWLGDAWWEPVHWWGVATDLFESNHSDKWYQKCLKSHRARDDCCRCSLTEDDKDKEEEKRKTQVLSYLHCGFSKLIATVHLLEMKIEGLDIESLKKD
ncbi:hypothetical protein F4679DRAFT_483392 [Xylaria curta]|nr:hypothetical protein F4679DRAFT_483392 [Xylaria curta]